MSFQNSLGTLSLKDIMENGFLITSSSYSISPGSSSFLEMNSIPKSDTWDSAGNLLKGSSPALKSTDCSLSNMKGDLQASCDGATSFCKTPLQPYTFDLSNVSCSNSSKANSTDVFCDAKSSTPCKEEKSSKLTENMLLKSSEINDEVVFKKPPPPVWEISVIQATLDNTLSLEASLEEHGSLSSMKTDTPSLEMSHLALALASNGVSTKKHQSTVV